MIHAKRGGGGAFNSKQSQSYSRNVEQQTTMGKGGTMMLKNQAMFGEEISQSTIKQHRS
jgi:hypothetical protein